MATAEGIGFCDRACEIDQYLGSVAELQKAVAAEDTLELDSKSSSAAILVADYHQEILDQVRESASVTPCPGYNQEDKGLYIEGLPELRTSCPIVRRIMPTLIIFTGED
jgi:hypothetical protein